MNYTVPSSAAHFPPNMGPAVDDYQSALLTALQSQTDARNANEKAIADAAVASWTTNNIRNQAMNLAFTAKPVIALTEVLHSVTAQTGDTVAFMKDGTPDGSVTVGAGPDLYAWVTDDGAPVAVCPDIPAVAPVVHPIITGNGSVMNVPVGDTMPIGTKATAPDGSVWEKQSVPGPWGTYVFYQKIS